ncbi:MAG TPA: patatin-like phospholipase family protein [Pseudolabrys sp.]|nr:patatin-like phospholipase family protein [Pseudolabrys sp.]
MPDGDPVQFNKVFQCEVKSINERRPAGAPVELEDETLNNEMLARGDGTTPLRPTEDSKVVGLALSGGGIRSAAFCLGALQALDASGILRKIDYMSTVSGGGYIGCSLASGLKETAGVFPFASKLTQDETPSLQHIRDYSNYLFPKGPFDLFRNGAIYARGLVANAIVLVVFLCTIALLNIFLAWHPDFKIPLVGWQIKIGAFILSGIVAAIILLFVVFWGLWRSFCAGTASLPDLGPE